MSSLRLAVWLLPTLFTTAPATIASSLDEGEATPEWIAIERFVLSSNGSEAAMTQPVGQALAAPISWRTATASFDVPGPVTAGRWTLVLGPGGSRFRCELNGGELPQLPDAENEPELAAPSAFNVSHLLLREGANEVKIEFEGESGRGFEVGPAYLLAPSLATLHRAVHQRRAGSVPITNLVTRATQGPGGALLSRVAFKTAPEDPGPRLHAMLELVVRDDESRQTTPAGCQLKQPASPFPFVTSISTDPALTNLSIRQLAYAPLSLTGGRLNVTPAVCGSWGNLKGKADDFAFRFHVHLFPTRGGVLRTTEVADGTLLHNDHVGLWVNSSRLLGPADQPRGFDLNMSMAAAGSTRAGAMIGPSHDFFMVGGATAEELVGEVERLHKRSRVVREDVSEIGHLAPCSLDANATSSRNFSLTLLGRSLQETVRRGRGWCLAHGDPGARGFWAGSWINWLFPDMERALTRHQLENTDETGAVFGGLGPTPSERAQAEATAYALLRLARYVEWNLGSSGDLLREMHPAVTKAFAWLESRIPRLGPRGEGEASSAHLRCAEIAALERLARAYGSRDLADPAPWEARARELRGSLFAALGQGGEWEIDHLREGEGDDPLGARAAILLGAPSPDQAAAWAKQLARTPPPEAVGLDEILLVHALLRSGLAKLAHPRLEALAAKLAAEPRAPVTTAGAYLDLLVFGLAGVERGPGGELRVNPRSTYKKPFTFGLPLQGGKLQIRLSKPNEQFHRSLTATNGSEVPVQMVLGVPGRLGRGEKREIGELQYSLYEFEIAPKATHREQVR